MERSRSETNLSQTLIPLTSEIIDAMMDFNDSSEFESSNSLTDLVRKEINSCLRVLDANIDNCIKREELSGIINQCLEEKLPLCIPATSQALNNNPTSPVANTRDRDMEVTIQFIDNDANSDHLKENFSILEQRISTLESRISSVFQMIPRLKKISGKFKIDRKTLQQSIDKYLAAAKADRAIAGDSDKKPPSKSRLEYNPYDDMYYEWRQNRMNLLYYKQSECTLRLNKKLEMEQFHGPPVYNTLPAAANPKPKPYKVKFIKPDDLVQENE